MQDYVIHTKIWILHDYKIQFAVEQKHTKSCGQFQDYLEKIFCRNRKKMLVIQFPYMEIVW